ncbi:hypothetical protein AWB76_07471 [Caballeronia temeraria]|uniref:Uncharacterized protein n=1 Tax=Caballeronia temeraria TaxID=1777137 RepID=A0A158DTI4_9BURK|nr:hypothetical protein [Caballeronia temeraria]SAK97941.1 hypothetical protein AWB76_07471 [Caballeronia temeraria]
MRNAMSGTVKWLLPTLLVALVMVFVSASIPDEVQSAVQAPKSKDVRAAKVSHTTVTDGQVIELVVHSARDCKYCVRWKGPFAGEGHFKSWARSHPGAQLFIVERASIASNEALEDYPRDLQWLAEQNQKDQRLRPGTPMFEVFVERNLVLRSYGLDSWDDEVFPAIKDLDARRSHREASR